MPSLSKMAAPSRFPSIHDKTGENINIFGQFGHKLQQRYNFLAPRHQGVGLRLIRSAPSQVRAEPLGPATLDCSPASDYNPLDAFASKAQDPDSTPWSEDEELCELLIKMKEIELSRMIEETPTAPACEYEVKLQ